MTPDTRTLSQRGLRKNLILLLKRLLVFNSAETNSMRAAAEADSQAVADFRQPPAEICRNP